MTKFSLQETGSPDILSSSNPKRLLLFYVYVSLKLAPSIQGSNALVFVIHIADTTMAPNDL